MHLYIHIQSLQIVSVCRQLCKRQGLVWCHPQNIVPVLFPRGTKSFIKAEKQTMASEEQPPTYGPEADSQQEAVQSQLGHYCPSKSALVSHKKQTAAYTKTIFPGPQLKDRKLWIRAVQAQDTATLRSGTNPSRLPPCLAPCRPSAARWEL